MGKLLAVQKVRKCAATARTLILGIAVFSLVPLGCAHRDLEQSRGNTDSSLQTRLELAQERNGSIQPFMGAKPAQGQKEKPPSQEMTVDRLETLLHEVTDNLRRGEGRWLFSFEGVPMALLTSVEHDRMRIIAPVIEEEKITNEQRKHMLEANFHTALDARYATSNGIVYAAYIHPLSLLQEDEFRSALRQVAQLAQNFGTSYSSGELMYRGSDQGY